MVYQVEEELAVVVVRRDDVHAVKGNGARSIKSIEGETRNFVVDVVCRDIAAVRNRGI